MRSVWSRRDVLASTTAAALMAGCFSSRESNAGEPSSGAVVAAEQYDCDDIVRPNPDESSSDGTLEPRPYPEQPTSSAADAIEYVTEFERAYRQNAFIESYGDEVRAFELEITAQETDVIESDEDVSERELEREPVLIAIVYDLTTETTVGARDEWDVRATYYVDEDVVLRATFDGIAAGARFDPDPRTEGEPVACSHRSIGRPGDESVARSLDSSTP